jgi:predicted site-specific integrase-resolvase
MVNANATTSADFLLTNDVARCCNVSPQTIRVWERTGRLCALRTERGVRLFLRRDVDLLLERLALEREQRRTSPSAPARVGAIA